MTTLSTSFFSGLCVGILFMTLNFYILRRITSWMLHGKTSTKVISVAILMSKFGIALLTLWFLLSSLSINPLGLGIGIVLVPLLLAGYFSFHSTSWRQA